MKQLFPIFTEKQVGNMLVSMPGVVLYKGNKGHVEVTIKDIISNLERKI